MNIARYGFLVLGLAACGAPPDEATAETGAAITKLAENAKATQFPEAVLVNAPDRRCSGVLVAPRTVITAGHCVKRLIGAASSQLRIVAPNADGQTSNAVVAYDVYQGTYTSPDPKTRDIAMLTLDTPIHVAYYPPIREKRLGNGRQVRAIGRTHRDEVSDTDLFVGKKVGVKTQANFFALDYVTKPLVQREDAGGPVYVGRYAKRQLVGVISGTSTPFDPKPDDSLVASVAAGPNFDLAGIYEHPNTDDGAEEDAD